MLSYLLVLFGLKNRFLYLFLFFDFKTTIDPQYIFSPENAYWRYERAILSENWPLDEQHFWPGKSYDYNGYVDVIAAGKRLNNEELRPNMLTSKYINELERINEVLNI